MNLSEVRPGFVLGLIFCVIVLGGCSNESGTSDMSAQYEDMELVVTAQQGRVQNLEKQVSDLEAQLQGVLSQVSDIEKNSSTAAFDPAVLKSIRDENEKLVRLVFRSFAGEIEMDSLTGLIDTYENVFKMNQSYDESMDVIWVTDGSTSGELYILSSADVGIRNLGVFEEVTLVKWSPDNEHIIVETKLDKRLKGYLINAKTSDLLASMEYTGLPIWSFDGGFFCVLK